jgi:hypothetical protein
MKRIALLACAVAAGVVGGLAAAGRPPVLRADEGVTSVGGVKIGNPVAGKTDTLLWLTKGGSVYRCYRVNEPENPKPPFECVKQDLEFR